jgi:ArsR family transcriptional regulator, arsenate/arsenite/antimonite-responsive transcriptional repressor
LILQREARGVRLARWIRDQQEYHGIMSPSKSRSALRPLTDQQFRAITKAVSDPRRYEILQSIAGKQNCTCVELRETFPIAAATLSFHLKELESAGLITISREGKFALPSFRRDVWKTYLARLSEI